MCNKLNEKRVKPQYDSMKVLGDRNMVEKVKNLLETTMGIYIKDVTVIKDKALENISTLDHVATACLIVTLEDDTKKLIQLNIKPK